MSCVVLSPPQRLFLYISSVQFNSVRILVWHSYRKQDVTLHPGSNIEPVRFKLMLQTVVGNICPFVCRITQKVISAFWWHFWTCRTWPKKEMIRCSCRSRLFCRLLIIHDSLPPGDSAQTEPLLYSPGGSTVHGGGLTALIAFSFGKFLVCDELGWHSK